MPSNSIHVHTHIYMCVYVCVHACVRGQYNLISEQRGTRRAGGREDEAAIYLRKPFKLRDRSMGLRPPKVSFTRPMTMRHHDRVLSHTRRQHCFVAGSL